MHDSVTSLIDFAAGHQSLAYALVLVMAAAEALPILGTIVPGSAMIVGISALVPSGALALWPLIVVCIVGAAFGDGISFWLGRRYERHLATLWPLRRYPALLARSETLLRRHGGKSIFLARFIQGPRAFVPLAAGMSGMRADRFYAFNVASALLWASSHVLAGVVVGASLHLVAAIAGRLAIFLALVVLLLWAAVWIGRRLIVGLVLPALATLRRRLEQWIAPEDTRLKRRLRRYFASTGHRGGIAVLLGAIILGASLWLFLGILEDVITRDPLLRANDAIFHFLQTLRTTWGDRLMVAVTEMGDGVVRTAVTLGVLGLLLWRRAWRAAVYWLVAVGGATLFTLIIKVAVHWPRPMDLYSGWDAYSFPSGHATINTVLYGFLGVLVARELPSWRRAWVSAAVCVVILLIATSRLYLGAHWFADVAAGVSVGTAWTALLVLGYLRLPPPRLGAGSLVGVMAISLLPVWGFHMNQQLHHDIARYTPKTEVRTFAYTAWRTHAYRELPARRIDLGGETEEPITLQWAGDITSLRRKLLRTGWRSSTPWTLGTAARWFMADARALALPVLPKLHDGRTPVLSMVRAVPRDNQTLRRFVLLVWSTQARIEARRVDATTPLWLGSVVEQQLSRVPGLITLTHTQPSVRDAVDAVVNSLAVGQVVTRPADSDQHWDGRVLLAGRTDRVPDTNETALARRGNSAVPSCIRQLAGR